MLPPDAWDFTAYDPGEGKKVGKLSQKELPWCLSYELAKESTAMRRLVAAARRKKEDFFSVEGWAFDGIPALVLSYDSRSIRANTGRAWTRRDAAS